MEYQIINQTYMVNKNQYRRHVQVISKYEID